MRKLKEEEKMKAIHVFLTPEQVAEIDRISVKRKMGKGETLRMLLGVGIDCHKDLESIGVIPIMDYVHFMKKKMKDIKKDSDVKQLSLI